ncbi:unnamed protein product [Zymoseptoria tritici ST99CH_3D7]|uniref:Uncharacterized protein n=1 Tax=Zymoseptoria tritici (strain ST99CH_3D7) TaxID=1276538 RepID=A0A1X7SA15_ZYMT9|nr:unnamed protein product [Zymoseptoria tritici ST99CH_3D7]
MATNTSTEMPKSRRYPRKFPTNLRTVSTPQSRISTTPSPRISYEEWVSSANGRIKPHVDKLNEDNYFAQQYRIRSHSSPSAKRTKPEIIGRSPSAPLITTTTSSSSIFQKSTNNII